MTFRWEDNVNSLPPFWNFSQCTVRRTRNAHVYQIVGVSNKSAFIKRLRRSRKTGPNNSTKNVPMSRWGTSPRRDIYHLNNDWICFIICGTKLGKYTPRFQVRDYQSEKIHEPSDCDTVNSPNNSWFAVQHIRSFPGKIR